ncbi:hypothetical protein EB796_014414 [Bugula neritina]|uniref:Uncharacterized protein n=1 Tax=Bugula neritina TaxID=10212 RepID=A0A7J7JMG6_BUGNE|nr:hypothetical protein EB796_014414 [Bugula neritina]
MLIGNSHSTIEQHFDRLEPSSDEWKDIIPSQIAYGPHFFAHEPDQLKQIADIELILQDEVHKSIGSAPQPGDMVTVRGPIISPHCKIEAKEIYYRAQVCRKLDKKDCYLAIALDYGQLKRSSSQ